MEPGYNTTPTHRPGMCNERDDGARARCHLLTTPPSLQRTSLASFHHHRFVSENSTFKAPPFFVVEAVRIAVEDPLRSDTMLPSGRHDDRPRVPALSRYSSNGLLKYPLQSVKWWLKIPVVNSRGDSPLPRLFVRSTPRQPHRGGGFSPIQWMHKTYCCASRDSRSVKFCVA